MSQSKEQVAKLAKQFPLIAQVLKEREEKGAYKATVNISVQTADPDFLMILGDNINGVNGGIFRENKPGQIATKKDFLYTVGHDLRKLSKWDYHHNRSWDNLTILELIDYGDEFLAQVEYYIFLQVYNWHNIPTEGQSSEGTYLGQHRSTELYFEVYLAPKKGWRELIRSLDLSENVTLDNKLLQRGYGKELNAHVNGAYTQVIEGLGMFARWFQNEVYLKGLKELIDASKASGMSGQFGSVRILSYAMAGRIQFTLNDGTHDFSIIGEEGSEEPRMGYNSIHAKMSHVRRMVQTVIEIWTQSDETARKALVSDDNEVHLLGM